MSALIEELSLNAWPAVRQMLFDGWMLRFSDGYTRRANSVNLLAPGTLPLADKIDLCEDLYQQQRLNCVFKLTAGAPQELQAELLRRRYREEGRVSVQTLSLPGATFTADPRVKLDAAYHPAWADAFADLSELRPMHRPAMDAILRAIVPQHRFAMLFEHDEPVAAGLAVLERGWAGLFDIVTRPDRRRRGYASAIVQTLLAWAQAQQAQTAYLQVVTTNAAALPLYARLGFVEAYQYWYRTLDLEELDRPSRAPRVLRCA